jgi:ribosomal protein S18 acetylase RimI-like enzyme
MPTHQDTLVIVLAVPEDAAGLARVRRATWLATYPNDEHDITVEDIRAKDFDGPDKIARIEAGLRNPGRSRTWVAKHQDRIVAYCTASEGDVRSIIGGLYVHPHYQDQKIGRRLMEMALVWLGSHKPVELGVVSYNALAVKFYTKFGFELRGTKPPELGHLPNGKILPRVLMVREAKRAD